MLGYKLRWRDVLFSIDLGITINGYSFCFSPIAIYKKLKHNFALINTIKKKI